MDFAPRLTVATEPQPTALLVADVTGDGLPDLLSTSNSSSQLLLQTGLGGGRFSTGVGIPTSATSVGIAAGDFNEDGHVDVATANVDRTVTILSLDGHGRV